jgi:hypothetical protein
VTPFTFHVTDLFVVLVTVAVNCLVFLTRTLALVGEMLMPTGGGGGGGCGVVTVTDALPTTGGMTALLVACTVTVAGPGTDVGAVYNPVTELMKPTVPSPPTVPFTSQVTA